RWLRANHVARGETVAIYAHRSAPTVCAMLGVLEAGAATVLLDPAHPVARLSACLREARVRAVIEVGAAGTPPAAFVECAADLMAPRLTLPPTGAELDALLGGADEAAGRD